MVATDIPQRELMLGDIVVNIDPQIVAHQQRHNIPPERGVVVYAHGKGYTRGMIRKPENAVLIKISAGHYVGTDQRCCEHWHIVPNEERTTAERVIAVLYGWEKPEWLSEDDDVPLMDSFEGRLLLSLLPPEAAESAFDGGLPDYDQLWLLVADRIDSIK